jgi:alanine racemase
MIWRYREEIAVDRCEDRAKKGLNTVFDRRYVILYVGHNIQSSYSFLPPMFSFIRRILHKQTTPLNTISIDPWKFGANIDFLSAQHPHDAIFPVIKSNAYGHGIEQITTLLNDVDCAAICVDSYPEYALARRHSRHQFLVLSDTNIDNYRLYDRKRTAFVVSSMTTLQYFIKKKRPVHIHLFLNTGMNREGFDEKDLESVIAQLAEARHVVIDGVMSHLSHADALDTTFTQQQIDCFKTLYTTITHAGHTPRYRHIGASAGVFTINDPFFTAWRRGKAMYGYTPFTPNHSQAQAASALQPIASVQSTILNIRTIPE